MRFLGREDFSFSSLFVGATVSPLGFKGLFAFSYCLLPVEGWLKLNKTGVFFLSSG